jgi:hypothetical protein
MSVFDRMGPRNRVFLGILVALLLFVGAAVSVRSRAATSAVAMSAAASAASASRYGSSLSIAAGTQGLSNLELRRARSN